MATYDFLVVMLGCTSGRRRSHHMTNRIDRVIITGAGSGIGLDMARAFLARGARLVINGRDKEKLARARRGLDPARVTVVPGEVGDPATGRALAAAAQEQL